MPELFINLTLFIFLIRPLVDLQGKYEANEALNAGGWIGLVLFFIIGIKFFHGHIKSSLFYKVISTAFIISLIYLYNLIYFEFDSTNLAETARFLVGFCPILLLQDFASNRYSDEKMIFYLKGILVVTCIPIVITWLQLLGFWEFTYYDYYAMGRIGRPSGGYYQPSALGKIIIFDVLFCYILYIRSIISMKTKNIIIVALLFTVIVSTHRTSILLVCMAIFIQEFMLLKYHRILFGYMVSILSMAIAFVTVGYFERYFLLFSSGFAFNLETGEGLRGRFGIWSTFYHYFCRIDLIKQFFGVGYEVFEPHNDVLRTIMTTGIFGVCLHILLFSFIYILIKTKIDYQYRYLLNLLYLLFILFGITLQPTSYPNFMWLFFSYCFCIMLFFQKNGKTLISKNLIGLQAVNK